ncbi:MAG: hypothetical protein HQL71_08250 [Magnetococcales bacterium]|nr:hypothetical protein [Magnetococcales bacterium]
MNTVSIENTRSRLASTLNPLSKETINTILMDTSISDKAYLDFNDAFIDDDEEYFFMQTYDKTSDNNQIQDKITLQ